MKAYTDLEQSKKLAEILPLESADLWWDTNEFEPRLHKHYHQYLGITINPIPCWSLAALLDQLEDRICDEEDNQWELVIKKENVQYDIYYLNICGEQENIELDRFYDDLIDCCYEMILKLKERNLL